MTQSGSSRDLDQWLAWLATLTPNEIQLGLERVSEVLGRLELKRPQLVLHVAGTNGKGSCAHMLEAFLRRRSLKVGCYTSPHLQRYNERIRVDGVDCADGAIIAALERVEAVRNGVPLTYFEFGTLAALCVFEDRGVDAMVLEVGMGGRLDAVNAVEPDGGIITNVGLDHCEWLGPDVETIAAEKAGILRAGKPFVFGSAKLPVAVERRAAETGALLLVAGRDYRVIRSSGNRGLWSWRGRRLSLDGLRPPSLGATVQIDNAAAVLTLLEFLGMDELLQKDTVDAVLGSLSLAGRLQTVHCGRDWLLDVAHNADSARVLADSLQTTFPRRRIVAVIGMLGDKDVESVVRPLDPVIDSWIAVTAKSARAMPALALATTIAQVCNKPCVVADSIELALDEAALRAGADDIALICGSFYVVGPALDALYSRRQSGPARRKTGS
ncbi:MAG: bifunctional folylpolyglutamate synthase/dihydrofolate synthase [Woeseiaceae bacterium]|nr:bifunctional folylpolyglutamate synthase/dihydrofolate synthase [Woeseiaceae bacterium]